MGARFETGAKAILRDQLVDTYLALNSKPDALKDFYQLSAIEQIL